MTTPVNNKSLPFHSGEEDVQSRVGVRESVGQWARQAIRPFMPDQHREFYHQLPFMVASMRDDQGRPWATLLLGAPGFVRSPTPQNLEFDFSPLSGDVLEGSFKNDASIGLLGIELHTRRRNRINGTLSNVKNNGFEVNVGQSFGNCPQYISKRCWQKSTNNAQDAKVVRHKKLSAGMKVWIETADTLFIASGYPNHEDSEQHESHGMDVSHRGGTAGFVKIAGDDRLVMPDYSGNNLFNTIGNLVVDPKVGLLFVDFETGSLLQITGVATIDWDSEQVTQHVGAQRLIDIQIHDIVELTNILPLRWSLPEEGSRARDLVLINKHKESDDVTSFEFLARDGGNLPKFRAGQYLPIELKVSADESLERTYSLSNAPESDYYRISVKREPQGIISSFLHDHLEPGSIVLSRRPEGDFVIPTEQLQNEQPIVLISAGIGVTPILSMLHALKDAEKPIYFIHSSRDGNHHPLSSEIQKIVSKNERIKNKIFYSQPLKVDIEGENYDEVGRINANLIEDFIRIDLNQIDANFYLCGPQTFLADLTEQLTDKGVDENRIQFESF